MGMGITITYFFGQRMGVGMGMVFIYNQLLISVRSRHKCSEMWVWIVSFGQKLRK